VKRRGSHPRPKPRHFMQLERLQSALSGGRGFSSAAIAVRPGCLQPSSGRSATPKLAAPPVRVELIPLGPWEDESPPAQRTTLGQRSRQGGRSPPSIAGHRARLRTLAWARSRHAARPEYRACGVRGRSHWPGPSRAGLVGASRPAPTLGAPKRPWGGPKSLREDKRWVASLPHVISEGLKGEEKGSAGLACRQRPRRGPALGAVRPESLGR
jgi:hypothetical protein